MVCCDNPMCAIEWFHFECVGLRTTPEVRVRRPAVLAFSRSRSLMRPPPPCRARWEPAPLRWSHTDIIRAVPPLQASPAHLPPLRLPLNLVCRGRARGGRLLRRVRGSARCASVCAARPSSSRAT
eukprot:3024933-Prymnesium_polylepis.1